MNKHTKEYTSLIFKAVLSGIMISVGGAVYLLCENKIMGSFLFSFGLFTIVQRGFALYTGKVGYIPEKSRGYILDWAHATQGNASADAARTYLTFCLEGNIAGAEKYLDLFCKKSNTAKKYVQSWMPIVAASQSVKKKDKEKDILLSWVNVVDYE